MASSPQDTLPLPADASLLMVPHCLLLVEPGQARVELLALENFLGYTRLDLAAPGAVAAKVHPGDAAAFGELLAGQPLPDGLQNLLMRSRAGEWERVQARLFSLLRDEQGRFAQGALLIVPVSAMKLVLRSFMDNEARYRAVVRQATVGITVMDVDGRLTEWNDAFAEITGYTADEMLGRLVWEIEALMTPPGVAAQLSVENRVRTVQQGAKATWFGRRVPFRVLRKDGIERTVEAVYFHIHTPAGMMIGMVAQDITEPKAAEAA